MALNVMLEEVTVAVFIAKKKILRRSERMGRSNAGIVRNGHTKTALVGMRRLWTVLCVSLFRVPQN
jgi:hypothetical protein